MRFSVVASQLLPVLCKETIGRSLILLTCGISSGNSLPSRDFDGRTPAKDAKFCWLVISVAHRYIADPVSDHAYHVTTVFWLQLVSRYPT
eukprot:m.148953 g.148953  ORF g.148953 m.148953 type:complete len:90 (+) comp14195_c0_seq1:1573-1842(+)